MNILLFFDHILFLSSKTIHQFLTLPTCGAFGKEMSCVKIHTHIVWAQEQFLQWSFKMNDLANVFQSSTRTWKDWCSRRCPSGYGPNRCCPCRCCPSRSYPSNCGGCRARCCPSRSARGRGQARGRGRGRAQGRGRARPDNAAADADAEADEGSEANKSDSDAEADQADRWARGRNALRASRRRGLLQARRDQLTRSSKTKLTISQAEVERWIICSQMVMRASKGQRKRGMETMDKRSYCAGRVFR